VENIEFWMNFVVENSNKLQWIGFRMENELNVFILGANNTCYLIYPWRKIICFFLSLWYLPKPRCLRYVMELIIENFSMSRGATTWFKMFGAIVWNLLIIEPFFHRIFWKTKIENYIEIWGHSWYCWKALTKFDLINLIS
jgi:hypothetical protein